jgi:hypothetical protein
MEPTPIGFDINGYRVSRDALGDIPAELLASAVGVSVEEFVVAARSWIRGPGRPYVTLDPETYGA